MPTPLDSSQFEEIPSTGGLKPLDSSQVEMLPAYADGSTPLTPINSSPIDLTDSVKLSLGNKAGNIKYLKTKFEDVSKDKDGDLVVKDKGIWHRVDPKTFQAPDAWEASKIIAKKLPGLVGTGIDIAGSSIGAGIGALVGPAGAVGGAAAGGAAGEAARTSLGRLVGTYDATPEENLKDIAWEGLLSAGGETIALGVKPTMGMLKKSFNNINEWGSNFSKETLSSIWGTLTDAGKWGARRAMDRPGVIAEADNIVKSLGNSASRELGEQVGSRTQQRLIDSLADESRQALQKNYGQQLAGLVKEVPDNFTADVPKVFQKVKDSIVQAGYGYMDDVGKLKIFTDEQVARSLGTTSDQVPRILGENTRGAFENLTNIINRYSKYPKLDGKMGAKKLVELKRAVGESFDEFFQDGVPDNIKRIATGVKNNVEEGFAQQFADNGVGPQYLKMNADYAAKKDMVDYLNKKADNKSYSEIVKKMVDKSGAYATLNDELKEMSNLLGQKGTDMINRVLDIEAAKGFVSFTPKTMGGNTGVTAAKLATLGTQSNPRLVGKQIQYSQKTLDFMKSLPLKKIKEILGNDQLMSSMVRPVIQAYDGEDQQAEDLLKQAGVK